MLTLLAGGALFVAGFLFGILVTRWGLREQVRLADALITNAGHLHAAALMAMRTVTQGDDATGSTYSMCIFPN